MRKISIITVNYNNSVGLRKTMQSVVCQNYSNIEYIVIDGGSNDESVDVITLYKEELSFYVSESDGGIYYGMNKGIAHASGDYLLFLNSGDYLISSDSISNAMEKVFNEDIIVFRQKYIDSKGHLSKSPKLVKDEVNVEFFLTSVFPHQATFIKRSLFDEIGCYRTDLKIVSDWAFWTNAVVCHNASLKMFDNVLSIMEKGGTSSNLEKCQNEMMIVVKELMADGFLTWHHLFHVASMSRRYQFTQRNALSRFLSKIACYLGKRF